MSSKRGRIVLIADNGCHKTFLRESAGRDDARLRSALLRPRAGDAGFEVSVSGKIGVVVGSTRPRRICRVIAEWVRDVAADASPLDYELIDLADVALPFLDEPLMAAFGQYEHERTKRWSRLVKSFNGFVFVMPQYNWGYTAVLKNALDFLYIEWQDRAASTVTYGTHGGGKGADPLKLVLQGLGMRCTATNPRLDTPPDALGGAPEIDTAAFAPFEPAVRTMNAGLVEFIQQVTPESGPSFPIVP